MSNKLLEWAKTYEPPPERRECPNCGTPLTAARQGDRIVPRVFCAPCFERTGEV